MSPLRNVFFRSFLTETVYDQPLPSDVLGEIYPHCTQFWFIINGPIILFATFFETPCMNGDDDGLNSYLHAIPNISFLFVGEVLYMRNATIMKSLFYRIVLLLILSSTTL